MHRTGFSKPHEPSIRSAEIRIRLYVSGHSEYTRSVLNTLEQVVRQYDPEELIVDIRDAREADETERVFFTPMLIVEEGQERARRTIVVGDLLQRRVISGLLASYGVQPRA